MHHLKRSESLKTTDWLTNYLIKVYVISKPANIKKTLQHVWTKTYLTHIYGRIFFRKYYGWLDYVPCRGILYLETRNLVYVLAINSFLFCRQQVLSRFSDWHVLSTFSRPKHNFTLFSAEKRTWRKAAMFVANSVIFVFIISKEAFR